MLELMIVAAIAVVALMVGVWVASLIRRDASLVDRVWGAGFALVATVFWASAGRPSGPALLLLGLVVGWGVRLSGYLTWRNWGHGEDYRYQAMRASSPSTFALRSLVTVFLLQGAIMWIVALPLLAAFHRAASLGGVWVGIGVALWGIGMFFEVVGDWQLTRFRANPANRGRVLQEGVWRFTRHQNYFGDACLWWGFFCFAAAVGAWWTAIGPIVMSALLLQVSGVTLLERKLVTTKPEYRDYIARTSAFIPWPPRPPRGSSTA